MKTIFIPDRLQLPLSSELPVNILAACFNSTSATYKYYWFLSILQELEEGNRVIPKQNLFARMISNAWYTVNYFRISFGKQDLIQSTIGLVKEQENITIEEKQSRVFKKLIITQDQRTINHLWHFNKNVPHWFLSPWFPHTDRTKIYLLSKSFIGKCLYALSENKIEIDREWELYLKSNARVLKDFCYWNLSLYLQAKNPNVPDIPNKLIKPAERNNLKRQRTQFWDVVLEELGKIKCIYTGNDLAVGNYAVEHFIPYNFVSHDLIWNLIPADKSFNRTKSDKLPPLEEYFTPFFLLQKAAVEIMSKKSPKNKLLDEYLTIFPDLETSFSEEKFRERIQPLITIASNNGFEFLRTSSKID